MTEAIEQLAIRRNVDLLGRVPFDPGFTLAMVQGKNIFEDGTQTSTQKKVREIWKKIINSPSMNTLGIVDQIRQHFIN
jgi:MinD superfamily P-loop ATPase